jgi:homoserine kinase
MKRRAVAVPASPKIVQVRAFSGERVRLRVPATSANLGPGFDAFGLALAWHDELTVGTTSGGLDVQVSGEGAHDVSRDENHLVVRAMRAAFDVLGGQPPGLLVQCVNRIPHARGLGSSSAAIVGGIVAARELAEHGAQRLPDEDVLALATDLEGHPDNVAACLYGGFTIAWMDGHTPRAVRHDVAPSIRAAVIVPPGPVSTEYARKLLPEYVPHGDAAFAAGRAALLVTALTREPDLLLTATEDRLHQPYRAPAMPDSHDLVERLRSTGVAAMISGAGPTVLALIDGAATVLNKIATECAWPMYEVGMDSAGASRIPLS